HLARRGRLGRSRGHGDAVRRPASVSGLPEIVDALRRAGLLVRAPEGGAVPAIAGLTTDSRKLEPGMLYCAVRGSVQDGHRFVAAAAARGAVAALVARGARGATMEVSSHSLDQGRVDGLVFRAAIFTNLTREHLDYHKTLEEYFRAKAKLASYIAADGLEVVNADDPAWQRLPRRR